MAVNGSDFDSQHEEWKDIDFIVKELHCVILALLLIGVNSCVIISVWRKRVLQKPENYLLVSLALSDLSTGLFGLPLVLICSMAPYSYCILCYVSYSFTKFLSISTILHLLAVSCERYIFIVQPFQHERLRAKPLNVKTVLVCLWSISLAVAAVPFTWLTSCDNINESSRVWLTYTTTCLALFFVLPAFLLIYLFGSIFLVARNHTRRQQALMIRTPGQATRDSTSIEVRVVAIFLAMWLVFLICWSPYFVLNIMSDLGMEPDLPDWLWRATIYLRFLTSLLNPLLYSFLKKDFYQALRLDRVLNLFRCRHKCCPSNQRSSLAQQDVLDHDKPMCLGAQRHEMIILYSSV